jgi:uncharacterized protein
LPTETEVILGYGHENVQATHHGTVEFTKDRHLSRNGDCILVIYVDRGLAELSANFKNALQKPNAKLKVQIQVDDLTETIHAQGSSNLTLSDPQEIVIRKSEFASPRTLGVCADKAAKDLNRKLVEKLKNSNQQAKITLQVEY